MGAASCGILMDLDGRLTSSLLVLLNKAMLLFAIAIAAKPIKEALIPKLQLQLLLLT